MKMKHNNKGFSLVELIVVIAIMAILGGVGTAGYTKYIEQTNKKADMALVGNIMRAIETGTNSKMFVNDDSFKMGNLSYPIGFITLSTDGSSVVTSSTEMKEVDQRNCVYETINDITLITSEQDTASCGLTKKEYTKYTISSGSPVKYCTTHTTAENIAMGLIKLEGSNIREFTTGCSCTKSGFHLSHNFEEDKQPVSNTTIADISYLYLEKANGLCEYAFANQNATFTNDTKINGVMSSDPDDSTPMDTTHELYRAIDAAFDDPSRLKLKYDGWTTEEGTDFATFYLTAPELMEDIEELSGLLVYACLGGDAAVNLLELQKCYKSSEDVLLSVSSDIMGTFTTEDDWMAWWDNDINRTDEEKSNTATLMTWNSYGFGLAHREAYSAARVAYNNAFASYLEARGETAYAEKIRDFKSQSLLGVGLPGLVCNDAFTNGNSKLKTDYIKNAEDLNRVHKIYEEYLESDAFIENGKVIYNTMATFDATSDIANAYADQNGGDIYDYYNGYVKEMNALYESAQNSAGNGIVIIVNMEKGKINFHVSPNAANPRNK